MAKGKIARRLAPWVVIVAVAAGGWWLYQRRNDDDTAEKYRTDKVGRCTINETVTATGTISAVTTVQVGSQVSGIVARLNADFNSEVKRGQLVAELDPTPFQAALPETGRSRALGGPDAGRRNPFQAAEALARGATGPASRLRRRPR